MRLDVRGLTVATQPPWTAAEEVIVNLSTYILFSEMILYVICKFS